MTAKRLLVAAGAVAGSLGLCVGVGLTVASAASGSASTTIPPKSSQPSTAPMKGYCPNMGGNSTSSTGSGV